MVAGDLQSTPQGSSPLKILSPVLRVALLLGVCVHLGGFMVFRVVSNPLPSRENSRPFVQYLSPDSLHRGAELEEQAALFDSAPLFIPGEWNTAHNLQPPSRDRELLRFPPYEPEMDLSSTLLPASLPVGQTYEVEKPADLLALEYWDIFRALGKDMVLPPVQDPIGVFAQVRSLDGQFGREQIVDLELSSLQAFQPAVYFLRVEAGGRVLGRPTLATSSGDPAFDGAVYNWIVESALSSDLPSGLFEIRIYP